MLSCSKLMFSRMQFTEDSPEAVWPTLWMTMMRMDVQQIHLYLENGNTIASKEFSHLYSTPSSSRAPTISGSSAISGSVLANVSHKTVQVATPMEERRDKLMT